MDNRTIINKIYFQIIKNEKIFYGLITFIALLYIATAMQFPVTLRADAFHDDYLFWLNGSHLYNGDWLGPYSQMTLAKGAGFPFFLAINANLGIPVTLSIALFNVGAFYFVAFSLIRLGINRIVILIALLYGLFNPFLFPTHIIRDNIYSAATLIAVFSFIEICLSPRRRIAYSCFAGAMTGFFLIIREEGIWIFPALILFLFILCISLFKKKDIDGLRFTLSNAGYWLLACIIFIQIICITNYLKYDYYGTVDFNEKYYKKSVNILNSIEPSKRISHVPVSKEQREIAYSVSPSFSELKEYFEVTGMPWTGHGCNVYPSSCGDYAGGWFIWAYRDAVAKQGYYTSGANSSAFYKRVYQEISEACDNHVIQCKKNPFGFLPKLTQEQIDLVPESIFKVVKLLTHQQNVAYDIGPSTEPYDRLAFAQVFLRNPLIAPARKDEAIYLSGWFYAKGDAWPQLHCAPKDSPYSIMKRIPSPDIMSGMNDPEASNQRFTISLNNIDSCQLSYNSNQFNLIDAIKAGGGRFNIGNGTQLHFDKVALSPMSLHRENSLKLKSKISQTYKKIAPAVLILGLTAFVIMFIIQLWAKLIPSYSLLLLALWGLAATRIVILILVDISSFPAITASYMGPVFPITAIASTLSIALAIKFIHQIISRKNKCN